MVDPSVLRHVSRSRDQGAVSVHPIIMKADEVHAQPVGLSLAQKPPKIIPVVKGARRELGLSGKQC